MNKAFVMLLLLAGLINFLPVIGLVSGQRLQAMYGVAVQDPNLEILLRHRALLFGLLGGFMLASLYRAEWQPVAMTLGMISMLGFLAIAAASGPYNALIRKVALVDVVGIAALLAAALIYVVAPGARSAAA